LLRNGNVWNGVNLVESENEGNYNNIEEEFKGLKKVIA
jgi:hypothetical protein